MASGLADTPEAMARAVQPIHGERDLDRLLDQVATARLVLIGQASYGSHELNDLRGTLTRKLIAERGFAAVAIAGGWSEALRVDRYVRGNADDESGATALGGFDRFPTWMWRNSDVAAFVEWLATWNAQRPADQRAGFYGLDLYSLYVAIRSLLSFLDEADPAAARAARERYARLDHVAGSADDTAAPLPLSPGHEDEVVAQLVEMQRRHAARSGRTPAGDGWFHTMQAAQVLRNADAYYRAVVRGGVVWTARDAQMADTLDMLADQLGRPGQPARLIVWAHNRNAGDARATAMGGAGEISLGQVMRERHAGEVALIGMTTHTGAVTCARGWDEPTQITAVPPSLSGSWEDGFHAAGLSRLYVTAAALRSVADEPGERLQRSIGVVYRADREPQQHYHLARIADEFDIVVHVDVSRATAAAERTTGPLEPIDVPRKP